MARGSVVRDLDQVALLREGSSSRLEVPSQEDDDGIPRAGEIFEV